MNGSDGLALDGMYHEEHALPAFVHSRRKDQLQLPTAMIKGETPVIYFYSQIPREVSVGVDFPSGIWTSGTRRRAWSVRRSRLPTTP